MKRDFLRYQGRQGPAALAVGLLDLVTKAAWHLSALALLLILAAYTWEVFVRYFLDSPTSWTGDAIQWFLAAMVMLAIPEVTRAKGHIVISLFLDKMPAGRRRGVVRVISLLGFAVCMATAWICLLECLRQQGLNIETEWNHPIPKWWISSLLPLGFSLAGLQLLRHGLTPDPQQ